MAKLTKRLTAAYILTASELYTWTHQEIDKREITHPQSNLQTNIDLNPVKPDSSLDQTNNASHLKLHKMETKHVPHTQ
jgi:hypothetical protein